MPSNRRDRPSVRRVTAEIPADLYASLTAAKLQSGRSLAALMHEGIALICQHYRDQRHAERAQFAAKSNSDSKEV